ncbi:DUF1778 domain-containing protein [Kingella negevensis]|uniref:type II toxin -antitoxin system TacA 1-like antitoxin n=1 Tax=Kingella negevensis TaxID=1522312 RepID=UPI00050A1F8E|nr:DUF1778 domain-containing protein [Kingella negevensis]MDK4687849.1 DUF1778 domain-containing protein [Kingella negevensis]WII91156.1 DUF1778 domain-containing protein [Kingella negevensis]
MSSENINRASNKKGASPIVNVRVPVQNKDIICRAAELSGMPIAAFIRMAAIDRAYEVVKARTAV